jgi:hypothetical protein
MSFYLRKSFVTAQLSAHDPYSPPLVATWLGTTHSLSQEGRCFNVLRRFSEASRQVGNLYDDFRRAVAVASLDHACMVNN